MFGLIQRISLEYQIDFTCNSCILVLILAYLGLLYLQILKQYFVQTAYLSCFVDKIKDTYCMDVIHFIGLPVFFFLVPEPFPLKFSGWHAWFVLIPLEVLAYL